MTSRINIIQQPIVLMSKDNIELLNIIRVSASRYLKSSALDAVGKLSIKHNWYLRKPI